MTDTLAKFSSLIMGALGRVVPFAGNVDPMGVMHFFKYAFTEASQFRDGFVVNYNPTTHTILAKVNGSSSLWPCLIADEPLSYSFGFSSMYPIREGEYVLIIQSSPNMSAGIVVGRMPFPLNWSATGDLYNDPDNYHRRLYTQDDQAKKTWDRNIPSEIKPLQDPKDNSSQIATHFRPTDVYPGEFANINQHNCGIKGGLLSATLLGGGASLRLSALANSARLICEHYLRHSMLGNVHEFHNGRYLSSERNITIYQEERFGGSQPQDTVWTKDSEAPVEGEKQTMRSRMKDLSGFFGHISSKFCLRPDPNDGKIRVQGKGNPKDEGVSRETIDPSGQYRLSAAGMITLERTGRIPVPIRKCNPTDKSHDIDKKPEKLIPFEHEDKQDPNYRQLELFDRQAYDLKNQYSRVDGLGDETNSDYDVPQEEDLKPLKDEYDPKFYGNETVKLTKYDKRRAGAYIGEDGSIIIRDAWGSEITMLGGNVTIACAGNVLTLPGQTSLTIAGHDVIQKAQNSIDIHASEHDVRLSAARNMEIVGGGDENKYSGGVLIESRGTGTGSWDGKDKGEDARLKGVTIRTKKQGVVIDGIRVDVRSRKQTRIISGDKKLDGKISVAAKEIRAKADTRILHAVKENTFVITQSMITALARSIGLFSKRSFSVTKGPKFMVPFQWIDVMDVASQYGPLYEKLTKDLDNEKDASDGLDYKSLNKMIFGFRTSKECKTDQAWAIGGDNKKFRLYEPAWRQVMDIYDTLKGVKDAVYKEEAKWDNGRPFPGKDAENSAEYAMLEGMKPKNLTNDGFNKSRKVVEKKSSITTKPLKSQYRIRK